MNIIEHKYQKDRDMASATMCHNSDPYIDFAKLEMCTIISV